MRRFLSVWLPHWPIERRFKRVTVQDESGLSLPSAPLVLSASAQNGQYVAAANPAAENLGLRRGMPLADARAMEPSLRVEPADPEGDDVALTRLAHWHQCYSPYTRADKSDGVSIDITGCAHLFGGEASMLKEISRRLNDFGLTARLAAAPTIGAAWAAARYAPEAMTIITVETLHDQLAPLPAAALRLEADIIAGLARLGLKQIRDLLGKPRAPLAARFGPVLVEQLDYAFGKETESFSPLAPPPAYRAEQRFAEPVTTISAIEHAVRLLAYDLAEILEKAGKGARKVELCLFRVDGWAKSLSVHTSALSLSRDGAHLARLLCERLDSIRNNEGFGFEAATLSAFNVERYIPHQEPLKGSRVDERNSDGLERVLDRLINRFGARNVTRFAPKESYIPERSAASVTALCSGGQHDWNEHARMLQGGGRHSRPLLIFAAPEPVTTLAEVPDGPPIRFEWRRMTRRIARADGPERIAPEWWRHDDKKNRQTRDYYRVEDEEGHRYWLYRDGLHEREGDTPRWFIHGVFA